MFGLGDRLSSKTFQIPWLSRLIFSLVVLSWMMSSSFDTATIYTSTFLLSFVILSVYAYVRFMKLQVRPECISLPSEGTDCTPTLPRPPPLPDPPSKQSKSKVIIQQHKALLSKIRYQQQLHRLQRRRQGIEQRKHRLEALTCQLWCKATYLPIATLGACWFLVDSGLLWQIFGIIGCSKLCFTWWSATTTIVLKSLDSISGRERSLPVDKVALCSVLLPTVSSMIILAWILLLAICKSVLMWIIDFIIVAALSCISWSAGVPPWQLLLMSGYSLHHTAMSWTRARGKPFNLAIFCGLASEGVSSIIAEKVDFMPEGVLPTIASTSTHFKDVLVLWVPLFVVLVLWCPSLDKLFRFISEDVPAAFRESLHPDTASDLAHDVEEILQQQHTEWSTDAEAVHPTNPIHLPIPAVTPPPTYKSTHSFVSPCLKALFLTSMALIFSEPTNATPTTTTAKSVYQATSVAPSVSPFNKGIFKHDRLSWRERH